MVIGGVGATLHGSRFLTDDIDILVKPTIRNLGRLRDVLALLRARDTRRRGLDAIIATVADGGSVRLRTSLGNLDVLGEVPAEGDFGFAALARRAEWMELGPHRIRVAALRDLIGMKERAHRAKDLARLPELRAIALAQRRRRPPG